LGCIRNGKKKYAYSKPSLMPAFQIREVCWIYSNAGAEKISLQVKK